MNVLIILGHPRNDSLCGALAEAYRQGAVEAGASVEMLRLADLKFELNVYPKSPRDCVMEEDITRAIEAMKRADHMVFVYPAWWGTMPALLKGFLDRTLLPGVAFTRRADGGPMVKLWKGKSAQLITTMDTPLKVYHKAHNAPGDNAMRHSALGFCGIEPVHVKTFSPAKEVSDEERAVWLEQTRSMGRALKDGFQWTRAEHFRLWLKALRLQFYPKTFIAYTLGAVAVDLNGLHFSWPIYLLGYLVVFALEAATVLSNEYFDAETDKLNQHFTSMSGGSRVLVDGQISAGQIKTGIIIAMVAALVLVGALMGLSPAPSSDLALLFGVSAVLSIGYTAPPLRLSYRTLGELDVIIVNSILAIMWAYVLQGGAMRDPFPWLLGVPLALATLPAIALAGVPDRDADAAVGKKTLAVRLGVNGAVAMGIVFTALSALSGVGLLFFSPMRGLFLAACIIGVPHAVMLMRRLIAYLRQKEKSPLVNPLIGNALIYSMWYSVVPLMALWWLIK